MKQLKYLLIAIAFLTIIPDGVAEEANLSSDSSMAQAYLQHWFSIDPAEPHQMHLSPMTAEQAGQLADIHFVSDDGQTVNGTIAYPVSPSSEVKLALLLHPMGTDQHFWWRSGGALDASSVSQYLRHNGYTIMTLDARRHGKRGDPNFGPRELLKRAHSDAPRLYIETIVGSVRDYRILLNWAAKELAPSETVLVGYSMGAQMSLLLASYEPTVDTVVSMVPPYVADASSPVAPRVHVPRISNARVLWLAGTEDPHSTRTQTEFAFTRIGSPNKSLVWYESGHRLPAKALEKVVTFLSTAKTGEPK